MDAIPVSVRAVCKVTLTLTPRTISGCLKPTPVFQLPVLLPVLAGIAHAGLRRKAATLALARKAEQTLVP